MKFVLYSREIPLDTRRKCHLYFSITKGNSPAVDKQASFDKLFLHSTKSRVMKNLKSSSFRLLYPAIAFIAVLILITCEKPFEPVPPLNYVFYFNDGGYFDKYYRYYSATQSVDSIIIPYDSRRGMAVSPDGKRLYLANRTNCSVVDADSLQLISQIDIESSGGVAVSPDNKYVALLGDDLRILSTIDHSLIFQDTDDTQNGVFSSRSDKFYCAGGWAGGATLLPYVYCVDLSDTSYTVTRKTFSNGATVLVIPSIYDDKWFLYLTSGTFDCAFEVYDCILDSIIFSEYLTPGAGDIEISPDGKYVFYTNPGTILVGPPGDGHITVYDIEKNEIHSRINTPSQVVAHSIVQHLAISPDGRKLVGEASYLGEFVVVDLRKMLVTESYYFGNDTINYVNLWDVACQSGR